MSRIYFHSQEFDDAEVRGSERAWMGCLISDIMLAVLGDLKDAEPWLKRLLKPGHYLHSSTGYDFARNAATFLKVGMDDKLWLPNGTTVETWTVGLNTALILGGDALKLFVRLHAQCEIHCWIEGAKDKQWLADIIEAGLEKGPMRQKQGWESVIALLRREGDFPVVCSYSVCDQFPNYGSLPEDHPLKLRTDEDRHEAFYELPAEESWEACMKGLRSSRGGLRITRKDWNNFHFGAGISAFNLRELATTTPEQTATV